MNKSWDLFLDTLEIICLENSCLVIYLKPGCGTEMGIELLPLYIFKMLQKCDLNSYKNKDSFNQLNLYFLKLQNIHHAFLSLDDL